MTCEVTHTLFLFSSLFAVFRATFFNGRDSVMYCSRGPRINQFSYWQCIVFVIVFSIQELNA